MERAGRNRGPLAQLNRRLRIAAGGRPACRRGRGESLLVRLARDTQATSAMEFVIVAPVLFALIIATFELVLVFLAQSALETACEGSARYVLTGQAQTNFKGVYDSNGNLVTTPQQQFNTYICSQLAPFMGCGLLFADVNSSNSYSAISVAEPPFYMDTNGNVTNTFNYVPGTQGQIVSVRLFYLWPTFSIFGFNLSDKIYNNVNTSTVQTTNYNILIATSVAKTEGY